MTAGEFALLILAGIGAGLVGSMAGLASLISYPALLATGLPPVTANVTNTVALVLNGVGAVSASRPELTGQGRRVLRLSAASVLGGITGAALLLLTPSSAFEKVVPFLIAGASIAILIQRPPRELAAEGAAHHPDHRDPRWLPFGTYAIAIYGGYFGAAAGVMMLAMFLLSTGEGLARGNALRNVVLGFANAVAAIGFIIFSSIAWSAALPLCGQRTGWADHDHVLAHSAGGPTTCTNLCCLCRSHHRLKTLFKGWLFAMELDGTLHVTTPSGITRTSRPPHLRRRPPPEPPPDDPPPF